MIATFFHLSNILNSGLSFFSGLVCWRSIWVQVKGQLRGGTGPVPTALFMTLNVGEPLHFIYTSPAFLLPCSRLFHACVFSRCQSRFQRRPCHHPWREGAQREPEDHSYWHRHRPVHLRICPGWNRPEPPAGTRGATLSLLAGCCVSWWNELFSPEGRTQSIRGALGSVKRKLLHTCWAKEPRYLTSSALWRTCLMFSFLTCRAASTVLLRARTVTLSC